MTLLEGLIGVVAIAVLICAFILARLAGQFGRAAEDISMAARHIAELTPAVRSLIEQGRSELEALKSLTQNTTHVVKDVREVSGQVSAVASHLVRGIESEVTDRYRSILAGARAGFDALRRFRSGNGSNGAGFEKVEEFDHMR